MRAKLAFTVHTNRSGQLEVIGYIDKNEIEWLCQQLRTLGTNDHIHFHAGDTLFSGSQFPLESRGDEVPIAELQLNCIDPVDFERNPFE